VGVYPGRDTVRSLRRRQNSRRGAIRNRYSLPSGWVSAVRFLLDAKWYGNGASGSAMSAGMTKPTQAVCHRLLDVRLKTPVRQQL
jgi:hypothetical protein